MRTLLIAGSILALTAPVALAQTATKPVMPAAPAAAKPTTAPAAASTAQAAKFLVFFDWDKYNLTPEAARVVAQAADEIKKGGTARVMVIGHTDTSGSATYNQALSERRATTVKNELIRLGVPASTITSVGRGQNDLLVPTPDNVRNAENRRASIEFPRAVAAAPAPAPTPAAAPPPPPPLLWAIGLGPYVGWNLKENDHADSKSTLVGPKLSAQYLATPNLPIMFDAAITNTLGTSVDDGYGYLGKIGPAYMFNAGAVHPYIGAKVGYRGGRGVQDGPIAGPEAGLQYDFSRNWFGHANVGYDISFLRNGLSDGIVNGGLGAGYRF